MALNTIPPAFNIDKNTHRLSKKWIKLLLLHIHVPQWMYIYVKTVRTEDTTHCDWLANHFKSQNTPPYKWDYKTRWSVTHKAVYILETGRLPLSSTLVYYRSHPWKSLTTARSSYVTQLMCYMTAYHGETTIPRSLILTGQPYSSESLSPHTRQTQTLAININSILERRVRECIVHKEKQYESRQI